MILKSLLLPPSSANKLMTKHHNLLHYYVAHSGSIIYLISLISYQIDSQYICWID